ncbi:MAG TPA: hypothetical protein ENN99_12675 [Chloroflexi bacterium]|nr:hypothetical protein [Chloroflexota bacterium]
MMPNDKSIAIYTHRNVSLDALRDLLRSGPKWAYVSRLDEAQIVRCDSGLPESWQHGRAFGPKREVRWQKIDDHYRVDVLTEDSNVFSPDEGWKRTAPDVDGFRERTILLWGELGEHPDSPEEWIEVRIPRPLHYPVDNLQRPKEPETERALLRVVIRGYDYTVDNVPVATRWAVLEQDRPMP